MNETVVVISAVPLVLGLTQVAKMVGMPSKYAPLLALVIGISYALGLQGLSALSIVQGISYGLSAAGLYTGTKTVAQEVQNKTFTSPDTTTQPSDPATPPTT